uniref:Uncharacterized protein n=1 Tax=Phakopsora pachyrhizi TaxID=170000 RepID=A0A0S1MIQ3_PHAPC
MVLLAIAVLRCGRCGMGTDVCESWSCLFFCDLRG